MEEEVKQPPIVVDQDKLQKNIEAQLGGLTVQCCIKDAIIEQLMEENRQLKKGLLMVPMPNGLDRQARPVSGQGEPKK